MGALTPIDRLMVTAGRCALRITAPLPKELVEQLVADRDAIVAVDRMEEGLLCSAALMVIEKPDSQVALNCLIAARDLVAAMRAPEPEPEHQTWQEKVGLVGGG